MENLINLPVLKKIKNYGFNPIAHIGKGSYVLFV